MATLPRPGARIRQVTEVQAPTVTRPALMPCVVAPCFQIVDPLKADGTLNTSAEISTSALLQSAAAVAEPVSLSGKKISLKVNGGQEQIISFPTTVGGAGISHAQVQNVINKQLTGAVAEFREDKLLIFTEGKGSTQMLEVKAVEADDVPLTNLGLLALKDVPQYGKSAYENLDYVIRYGDLPTTLAPLKDLVFDSAEIDLYRWLNNQLTQLSTDSAVNVNSELGGTTKVNNVELGAGADNTTLLRPAMGGGRQALHAPKSAASKTDTLYNIGQHASLIVPLADGDGVWPDASAQAYLKVEAVSLQEWVKDSANGVGDYIGTAGNAVVVRFTRAADAAASAAAAWDGANDRLTITYTQDGDDSDPPTFAQLKAALDALNNDPKKDVQVSLVYPTAWGAKACLSQQYIADPGNQDYYLQGGKDPFNFGYTPTNSRRTAHVTGAVHIPGSRTPADLGVNGGWLDVSIDGGAWIRASLSGDSNIETIIDTALGDDGTCVRMAAQENALGTGSIQPLQIRSASTDNFDSSIQLRASSPGVLNALFAGAKTHTESNVATAQGGVNWDDNGRRATVAGTAYNKNALAAMQKAVVKGSVTTTLVGVEVVGSAISDPISDATVAGWVADNTWDGDNDLILKLSHSTVDAGATKTLTIEYDADATLEDGLVAQMNAARAAAGVDGVVVFAAVGGRIVASNYTGTGTLTLVSAGSTAALVTAFGSHAFDSDIAAVTSSIEMKDNGTDSALQVTRVYNDLANVLAPDDWSKTTAATLTTYLLDTSGTVAAGDKSFITYDSGDQNWVFSGAPVDADEDAQKPLFIRTAAGTTANVTFSRGWPHAFGPRSHDYTRVFHGESDPTLVGDTMYNAGTVLGRVVAIESLSVGAGYAGAQLKLSEQAVDAATSISDWYIRAEGLDQANARMAPEVTVSQAGQTVSLKQNLNLDSAGFAQGAKARIFVGYKALRKDVSAAASNPNVLVFNDVEEIEDLIGPISLENPLALMAFQAKLAAPTVQVSAIGLDENSADAPLGTLDSYARCFDFLGKKRVHAIGVASQSRSVAQALSAHCTAYSTEEKAKWRFGMFSLPLPTEKEPLLAASGEMTIEDIGGGKYELTFTDESVNVASSLNGMKRYDGTTLTVGVGTDFTAVDGVFLDRAGDPFRWLVTKVVSATTIQIDTGNVYMPGMGPGSGGNDDAYFQTDTSHLTSFEADGEVCSIGVRQAAVTTDTAANRTAVCEVMGNIASGFASRRAVYVQPAEVGIELNGTDVRAPAYAGIGALCGMCGQIAPQLPLTARSVPGITSVYGSSDVFEEGEMAVAAAGGVFWLIQDENDPTVIVRHQLSTDTSSLKMQELSILRAADLIAYGFYDNVKRRVGRVNIDEEYLNSLGLVLQSVASGYQGSGRAAARVSIESLGKSTVRLDGVEFQVRITHWFPVNDVLGILVS